MQNDKEIVYQFLHGNSETIKEIYDESFENVEKYILSNGGSSSDAEDVFHNGLIQIYAKLKDGNFELKSFHSYVFIICRNLWRKESSKKRVTNSDVQTLVGEEYNQAKFSIEQNQWELYKEKFDLLSDNCKELLTMIFKKKNYKDIVAHYDYSTESVARQRVFKCKSRLVKLISEDNRFNDLKA